MYDTDIKMAQIELNSTQAYDFRPGTAFSWVNDVFYDSVRVHDLKSDQDYINVASCFTQQGINTSQVDHMRNYNWTLNNKL